MISDKIRAELIKFYLNKHADALYVARRCARQSDRAYCLNEAAQYRREIARLKRI